VEAEVSVVVASFSGEAALARCLFSLEPQTAEAEVVVASDADIEKVVTTLRDQFKVEYIAPGHCTGEPAFVALKKAFGDRYLFAGLGTTLEAGARPSSNMH